MSGVGSQDARPELLDPLVRKSELDAALADRDRLAGEVAKADELIARFRYGIFPGYISDVRAYLARRAALSDSKEARNG